MPKVVIAGSAWLAQAKINSDPSRPQYGTWREKSHAGRGHHRRDGRELIASFSRPKPAAEPPGQINDSDSTFALLDFHMNTHLSTRDGHAHLLVWSRQAFKLLRTTFARGESSNLYVLCSHAEFKEMFSPCIVTRDWRVLTR